ncbi:RNA-directed DNA polymerase, eukaryota, reverse transcriptase zinc-binding domain protein [Tanacetum coccineum]
MEVEDYGVSSFSQKRLCLRTKSVDLIGERFRVIVQGRLYWIRVKELEAWVPDFHDKTYVSSSYDGEPFEEDDGQVSGTKKQDKVNNDDNEVDRVSETSFGYEQEYMHGNLNKLPVDEVHSEDPFKIYDILEKKKENTGHSSVKEPKFSPGFTPIDKEGEEEVAHHIDHPEIAENNMEPRISNDTSQRCKNLFSKVQNGGSFLEVMDELVKVGQTMGYNMEGCMNNIEAIIGSQGDSLMLVFPHLSAICLVKHLSDHRPILMRELNVDYGAIPFRVSHSWFNMEGFDKMVENSWKNSNLVETNGMVLLKKKLQMLKEDIKLWSKEVRKRSSDAKLSIQKKISDVDKVLDQGGFSEDNVKYRSSLLKELQDINSTEASDIAQKAKVRWSIEGDENSKYFHGIHNKKRSQIAIRGVLADGEWIDDPCTFPRGCNDSFITIILKIQEAKLVKDFRPISLIGSVYKIIAKVLANRMSFVMSDLISGVQSDFVANRQILDGPFILNELIWISGCLHNATGSVLVNGSPSSEFCFHKGLKQGDPLSPFLFILIMESLHVSFGKIMDVGLFKGEWDASNINTIVNVLKCFNMASGLRINIHKSKLMGIGVHSDEVYNTARIVGCSTFSTPFNYLGVKVGGTMSKISSWDEVISNVKSSLSNGNFVILSIGEKGGLGLTSLFALNHGLMFKWLWRFKTQIQSLWTRVIKAIYGANGALDKPNHNHRRSPWLDILREASALKIKGIDFYAYIHKKVGNGEDTLFWGDPWLGENVLRIQYPRLYALETCKSISVADKMKHDSLSYSFRHLPRGGAEDTQFGLLNSCLANLLLPQMRDRWYWSLEGSGEFFLLNLFEFLSTIPYLLLVMFLLDGLRWFL